MENLTSTPFSMRVSGSAFMSQYHLPSCFSALGFIVGTSGDGDREREPDSSFFAAFFGLVSLDSDLVTFGAGLLFLGVGLACLGEGLGFSSFFTAVFFGGLFLVIGAGSGSGWLLDTFLKDLLFGAASLEDSGALLFRGGMIDVVFCAVM